MKEEYNKDEEMEEPNSNVVMMDKKIEIKKNEISELEKDNMPWFFDGTSLYKNNIVYINMRNTMIELYENSNKQFITLVECKKEIEAEH